MAELRKRRPHLAESCESDARKRRPNPSVQGINSIRLPGRAVTIVSETLRRLQASFGFNDREPPLVVLFAHVNVAERDDHVLRTHVLEAADANHEVGRSGDPPLERATERRVRLALGGRRRRSRSSFAFRPRRESKAAVYARAHVPVRAADARSRPPLAPLSAETGRS